MVPCVVVGVGCAYADAVHFIHGIIGLDKASGFGVKFVEIIGELAVFSCLDRRTCNHFASGVHQAEHLCLVPPMSIPSTYGFMVRAI